MESTSLGNIFILDATEFNSPLYVFGADLDKGADAEICFDIIIPC